MGLARLPQIVLPRKEWTSLPRRPGERDSIAVALHRLHVRRAHLLQVLHEHDGEVVVDRGPDEMLTGSEFEILFKGESASASCTFARAPAAHQSSQRSSDPVTSSKSASSTPFETKRGAQWEIAEATRGSFGFAVIRATRRSVVTSRG